MDIPLREYIRKTIEQINLGLPQGYVVEESIDFEVSVTTSTNKAGGIEIKVFSGGIRKEKESVQTVYFSVINAVDKENSAKKSGENVLKYIDKGLKKLSKYSGTNNQERVQSNSKEPPKKKSSGNRK